MFGFGKDKNKEYRRFEKLAHKVWKGKTRERDRGVGILSRDLLNRRKELTQNGKFPLVLQYGTKGMFVQYTLDELDAMHARLVIVEKDLDFASVGIPIKKAIALSQVKVPFGTDRPTSKPKLTDYQRAQGVKSAVPFKIDGDVVHFRVTARTKGVQFYEVKIRLCHWDHEARSASGGNYNTAAAKAVAGNVAFDCTCGRQQYWFRYKSTVGAFGLDVREEAFPKIRNKTLRGGLCKHIVKSLSVLQTPVVQRRIAMEMGQQAKKEGWFTKLIPSRKSQVLTAKDLAELEEAGAIETKKAFEQFNRAQKAYQAKRMDPGTKQKLAELKLERRRVTRDLWEKALGEHMALTVYRDMKTKDQALALFAQRSGMSVADIKRLGAEVLKGYPDGTS